MSKIRIEESVEVARNRQEVWEAVADYGFDAQWRRGLVEMTPEPPGPPAVGTKVHEVVRNGRRDYVADTVVTSVDPGRSYRFEGQGSIGGLAGGRSVVATSDGGASVFTYTIELEPQGWLRLLRPVLGSVVRSGLRRDLATFREALEARPA